MEASPRAHGMYYRCPARTLAPGSPVLAQHPPAVYLREEPVRDAVNGWIGDLFAPEHVDQTVRALVESQDAPARLGGDRDRARQRLADAEARLTRFQAAIAAGIDPEAVAEAINDAQAQRAAARAELDNAPVPNALTDAAVYAMIDSLGDVGAALHGAKPERLAKLYEAIGLQVRYEPDACTANVTIQPVSRVNSARVRGGTCTLTTRLDVSAA